MKYVDIKSSITKKLYDTFNYKVLDEEIKQGLDKKRPCFFVQLIPLKTTNFAMCRNRLINVDITFFSANKTNEENLLMQDDLEKLFNLNLKVLDRVLLIEDLNFRTVDTDLHCIFTLDYLEGVETVSVVLDGTNSTIITKQEESRLKDLGYTEFETMQNLEIERIDN
ncbi:MAG: DUF6838 family protein [Clostridiaceae bacterium]